MNLKSGSTQRSPFNIPATSNWSGNTTTRSIRFNGTSSNEANGCLQRTKRADLLTSLAWVRHFWVGLIAVQRNLGLGPSWLQRKKSTDVGQATKGCSPLPVTQSGRAELQRCCSPRTTGHGQGLA